MEILNDFELDIPVRGRLVCRVRVKRVGNFIHLLDLDGDVSLTNAMGRDLQIFVLDSLGVNPSALDNGSFTWVLYHTDGVVSSFDGSFGFALPDFWDAAMAGQMHRLYGEGGRY